MAKLKRFGGEDGGGRSDLALPGQDVQHHVAAEQACRERLGAGGLDRRQPVGQDGTQDVDHLPVAVGHGFEFAAHALQRFRQSQAWNGAPFRKAPGFLARTGT